MFDISIETDGLQEVINKAVNTDNAQRFFSNELMRLSADYVPFDTGLLSASARVSASGDAIIYETPYARYLWYGKLMVDPITGKGAFFNEKYGFWSRPGVQKKLTDKDLTYQGAPLRGSYWVQRCFNDNKEQLLSSTAQFISTEAER